MESIISTSLKRKTEEKTEPFEKTEETHKRQKSYNDIITLLEQETEDEPKNHDLSGLISTLQEEISTPGSPCFGPVLTETGPVQPGSEVEEVMRHLLEASDDELGIPSSSATASGNSSSTEMDGGDFFTEGHVEGGDLLFCLGDGSGIWEFEDHEANNYYNLLHDDVFI